jgi:hypothetical protein
MLLATTNEYPLITILELEEELGTVVVTVTLGLVVLVTIRFHFNTFVLVPYFVHTKLTVLLTFTFDPTLEHFAPSLTEAAADTCVGMTPQSNNTATATFNIFFL